MANFGYKIEGAPGKYKGPQAKPKGLKQKARHREAKGWGQGTKARGEVEKRAIKEGVSVTRAITLLKAEGKLKVKDGKWTWQN